MTLKELVNRTYWLLRADTPEAGDLSYPRQFIVSLINDAIKQMQQESGAVVTSATLDITAGTRTASLPSDFEAAKLVLYRFAGSTNDFPLQRWPLQNFAWPISTGSGMPSYYHIENSLIYLDLTPNDSDASIILYYYSIPTDLSLPESEPSFSASYHHYLPYYAASGCKMRDGRIEQAEQFKKLFEEGKRELRRKVQLEGRNNQDFPQVRMECYGDNDF